MYLSIVIVIVFISTIVSSDEPTAVSLCDNPVIHSAERLLNHTIRVYRDYHYWDLIGLPDRVAAVNGPYRIWFPNMAPIYKNASTHTGLAGSARGMHYKYMGTKWWSWFSDGRQRNGGTNTQGSGWLFFPPNGFSAAYHDGNASGEGYPIMVGFQGIKVYYFKAQSFDWLPIGEPGGYIGGKYGEKFPADITSAFSWPSDDPKIKYFVYLFKRDKHCFRPWISTNGKDCDEWRDNKELFGCNNGGGGQPTQGPPQDPAVGQNTTGPSNIGFKTQSSALSLVTIYLIFNLL